jgi:hypothetical protein
MGRRDILTAIACALVFTVVFLLMRPFVEITYSDDFSYAFIVKKLLETGHLVYNGWSAPMVITQAWWGWAWCKLLGGFSFVHLKISILPLAAGSVALCYLISRRAGLRQGPALFATALVTLSPLFLPLAMSFMTDIPALFCTLLALYAFSKSDGSKAGLAWLAIGFIISILGGMTRQSVWIVPLVVMPYLAWWRRRERGFLLATAVGYIAVIIDVVATSRWFARQHDVVLSTALWPTLKLLAQSPRVFFNFWIMHFVMTLMVIILPATIGLIAYHSARLWKQRKELSTQLAVLLVAIGAALELHFNPTIAFSPWMPNMGNPEGMINSLQLELSGRNQFSLPAWAVAGLSAVAIIAIALFCAGALLKLITPRATADSMRRFFRAQDGNPTLPILLVFSLCYCLLLASRANAGFIFDRYLLPILPCAIIGGLLSYQELQAGSAGLRVARWAAGILLIVYCAYGLASMQQLLAVERARNEAIAYLERRGVPPTGIAAGTSWDFWTQLNVAWLNLSVISNPTHPYDPRRGVAFALNCRYRIEFSPAYDSIRSDLPPIQYHTWLPPFDRKLFIDNFRNAWWLDPKASGKHPGYRMWWEDVLID